MFFFSLDEIGNDLQVIIKIFLGKFELYVKLDATTLWNCSQLKSFLD